MSNVYYNPFIPVHHDEPRHDGITLLVKALRTHGSKIGHCTPCNVESRELLCFACGEPYGSRV